MSNALIIGEADRAKIAKMRAVAAASPFDVHGVTAAADQNMDGLRDTMRALTIFLPIGFAVTYTHEVQLNAPPPGLCHHISISVDRPGGSLPSPAAVKMILEEFGMKPLGASHGAWIEESSPGEKALHVVQFVAA